MNPPPQNVWDIWEDQNLFEARAERLAILILPGNRPGETEPKAQKSAERKGTK